MPSRVTLVTLAFLSALVAQAATASGVALAPATVVKGTPHKPKRTNLAKSVDLWATINVCDTAKHPNAVGIRGSMPGLGNRRSHLQLRVVVQYKDKRDGKWHNGGKGADSGWKHIGATLRQVIESGQDFTFKPPSDGGSHLLRGSVRFRWKRHGKFVAHRRRVTEPGHRTTAGADPKGYSAAQCEITSP